MALLTQDKNIVITGFMGTGKTEVGQEVARRLGRRFIDMDELIAERLGMTIAEAFATQGEASFREQERSLCQELAPMTKTVIATGGGTLIPTENRQALARNGLLFCLTCEPEEILRRLERVEGRPLLDVADKRQRIKELLAERSLTYAQIPCQIDTTSLTVEETAGRVIELYEDERRETRIFVQAPTGGYEVMLGEGLLAQVGEILRQQLERPVVKGGLPPFLSNRRRPSTAGRRRGDVSPVAVVTNPTVGSLYGQAVKESLEEAGFTPSVIEVPDGERFKTLETVHAIYDRFADQRLDRGSIVLPLGGGVIGDLAGFAAATYMRGLPLVHLPTTLMAMIDSSLGGKVGVDHPQEKNLIGAFHQPQLVITDPSALVTLPTVEFRCGLAEVVKHGLLGSPSLLEHLETEGPKPLGWIIREAMAVKIAVIEEDPFERGRRAVLNLGHTFGHALETLSGYQMRHGEAVSIGLVIAARLAVKMKLCDDSVEKRLVALLKKFHLPTTFEHFEAGQIWKAMALDKKRRGKKLRFVLPKEIGQAVVTAEVPQKTVLAVLKETKS